MTNKLVLRTIEELLADYVPTYQPLYPLLLGNSQEYAQEVGKLTFKRLEAVGDFRLKHITPKDSNVHQVSATDKSKVFKKYFLANQFIQSSFQDRQGVEDVVKQVLDENQKLADDLLLLGEGTSGSDVVNNGLFYSGDSNYVLEDSKEIDNAAGHLTDLHAQVVVSKIKADLVAGPKLVIFYGATMMPYVNGINPTSSVPFKESLAKVLGPNYKIVEMPAAVCPSSANGWMIVNTSQVKLNYTCIPKLQSQGINEEKNYVWTNFLGGSMMVDVKASGAIIRQPCTFES